MVEWRRSGELELRTCPILLISPVYFTRLEVTSYPRRYISLAPVRSYLLGTSIRNTDPIYTYYFPITYLFQYDNASKWSTILLGRMVLGCWSLR